MQTVSEVFGQRVRWARRRKDMAQGDLANLATEHGQPMQQTVLSRIEAGQRGVGLGEFLVLSSLLDLRLAEAVTPLDSSVESVTLGEGETSHSMRVAELLAWARDGSMIFSDPVATGPPALGSPLAAILRNLADEADRAVSPAAEMKVAEAGISVLRGAVPALKISARREAEGGDDGTR